MEKNVLTTFINDLFYPKNTLGGGAREPSGQIERVRVNGEEDVQLFRGRLPDLRGAQDHQQHLLREAVRGQDQGYPQNGSVLIHPVPIIHLINVSSNSAFLQRTLINSFRGPLAFRLVVMADPSKRAEGVPGRDVRQPARAVRQLVPRQLARDRVGQPVAQDELSSRLL